MKPTPKKYKKRPARFKKVTFTLKRASMTIDDDKSSSIITRARKQKVVRDPERPSLYFLKRVYKL